MKADRMIIVLFAIVAVLQMRSFVVNSSRVKRCLPGWYMKMKGSPLAQAPKVPNNTVLDAAANFHTGWRG